MPNTFNLSKSKLCKLHTYANQDLGIYIKSHPQWSLQGDAHLGSVIHVNFQDPQHQQSWKNLKFYFFVAFIRTHIFWSLYPNFSLAVYIFCLFVCCLFIFHWFTYFYLFVFIIFIILLFFWEKGKEEDGW